MDSQCIHVSQTSCLLCLQAAIPGMAILDVLDLETDQHTASECGLESPCTICHKRPCPDGWFHALCYDVLMGSYKSTERPTPEDLANFADTVRSSDRGEHDRLGEIASTQEGLFSAHTKEIIDPLFSQDLLSRLPVEIALMIAEALAPCWYLNLLGETRRLVEHLRSQCKPQSIQLNLSECVWVSQTTYRGIHYVTQLSSSPSKPNPVTWVHCLKVPSPIDRIVVSLDYIGLRGIQLVGSDSSPKPDGSPWYKTFELKTPPKKIKIISKGAFVGSIEPIPNDLASENSSNFYWSSPNPPVIQPWNTYIVHEKPRLTYLSLDWHIRGLLVCCSYSSMLGIHGFSGITSEFQGFVDRMRRFLNKSPKKCWIYFPLNKEEFIKAAWVRKLDVSRRPGSQPVLVLHTSLGRHVTFGPQFPIRIVDFGLHEWLPLTKNTDGPITGIFHDALNPDYPIMFEFGVTWSGSPPNEFLDASPRDTLIEPPPVPRGTASPTMPWFMTKASVDGLIKIQICQDQSQPHHPISGILMFYEDGHLESLGQFRWEYDISREVLLPRYIEKGTIDGRDYIKDILNESNESCIRLIPGDSQILPTAGSIAWSFGEVGDRIIIFDDHTFS